MSANYVLAVPVENILTIVEVIVSMGMKEGQYALTSLAFCPTEPCSFDSRTIFRLKSQRCNQSLAFQMSCS